MPRLSDVAVPAQSVRRQRLELAPARRETTTTTTAWPPASTNFVLQAAPSREPPFDDEPVAQQLTVVGAHDQQLPFSARQSMPARMRLLTEDVDPQPSAGSDLPEPGGFARRFAIAVIETATGRRNASQLSKHTSPGVQAGLVRDAGRIGRLGTPARPASLHSMRLAEPVRRSDRSGRCRSGRGPVSGNRIPVGGMERAVALCAAADRLRPTCSEWDYAACPEATAPGYLSTIRGWALGYGLNARPAGPSLPGSASRLHLGFPM